MSDDDELLARAFRDVRPLHPERRLRHAPPPIPRPVRYEPAAAPSPPPPQTPAMPMSGIDARTQRKLRRGQMRPEARLDLHGCTQAQAFDVLARFLAGAQARGQRTVLEKLLEDISFTAADRAGETILIDARLVRDRVGSLVKDGDLSRFIL